MNEPEEARMRAEGIWLKKCEEALNLRYEKIGLRPIWREAYLIPNFLTEGPDALDAEIIIPAGEQQWMC